MKRLCLYLSLALLLCALTARAQFGSFGDVPIQIDAQETRFEEGVAVAEGNVLIRYGELSVYCDYAQYNPDTRDLLALGNVRVFQKKQTFAGERMIYNLETKQLTGADMRSQKGVAYIEADLINTLGTNAYQARGLIATTHDSSLPCYHIKARTVRIYPDDRIILFDAKLYVGETPVFYFPYIYQNLNKEQGFSIIPGYTGSLGAYIFNRYTYPLGDNFGVTVRLDFMEKRGVGAGLEGRWDGSKDSNAKKKDNWGRFKAYILNDISPETNPTSLAREAIDPLRYRVTFQDRTYLTEDIYATIDVNKLSDARFLQDFEPGEFKRNPNPDNVIALTKWDENYTVTLTARKGLNDFFDFTEKLPELAVDIKRQPIFGNTGLFYDGDNSVGYYRRNFAKDSLFADYETFRADSFHQITYPQFLFGWLSLVPKAGIRGTYYQDSGHFVDQVTKASFTDTDTGKVVTQELASPQLLQGGSTSRITANAGLETSFKISKAYEQVQSRPWGLDGLRHVLQPYANFSYVYTNKTADEILQFDRINPSTKQPPIDFPQFTSVDSIEPWTILRLGAHNRFETRRDNNTFMWAEVNSFFDMRFNRPEFERTFLGLPVQPKLNQRFSENDTLRSRLGDPGTFSNLYNQVRFTPLPWVGLQLETQNPVFDEGFNEVNTSLSLMATSDIQFVVSHRYLSGNILFQASNQLTLGTYLRMGENWGLTVRETYEFEQGILQQQRYELHRDLSALVGSFAFVVNNNGGGKVDYGVALTFTLKDLPLARLPLQFDPTQVVSGGVGKNQ